MKINNIITLLLVLFANVAIAQKKVSPPAELKASINGSDITINYSQPSVKGRTIFGDLVPYDKIWRTGANEATTFETSKDITIQGKKLKAGKYSLFTIPSKDEWTIVFNSVLGQWGAYSYNDSKNVLSVSASPSKNTATEMLTFSESNGVISMAWDKLKVDFTVK